MQAFDSRSGEDGNTIEAAVTAPSGPDTKAPIFSGLASISAGISEALITTGVGIGVAVLGVWLFNYFNFRVEKVVDERGSAASHVDDTRIARESHGADEPQRLVEMRSIPTDRLRVLLFVHVAPVRFVLHGVFSVAPDASEAD